MASFSYLIKGGTVIDGSGFPGVAVDVGIYGERIKLVGNPGRKTGTRVIDARGKIVIPGIVDITNHSDTHWTLFTRPSQESLLMQGVTTILGGLCGSSVAPFTDPSALRSIQKWVDISSINVNWRTVEEFFNELARHPLGVNFGTLVGHGTLRRDIADDQLRELTRQELDSMKLLLRRSLDEGALGISFGLSSSHGRAATPEEVMELASIAGDAGKIVTIHLRNEGRGLLAAVVEAVRIARATGAHIQISHLKAIGRKAWQDFPKAISVLRKARRDENLPIFIDFFPYLRTGSLLYNLLPEWALEGGKEKILATLTDQSKHDALIESLQNLTLHYDSIVIAEAQKDKHIVGKTIKQIAESVELPPEETLVKLLVTNGLGVTIFSKMLRSRHLTALAKEPYSMFASDGVGDSLIDGTARIDLTHPRSFGAAPRFIDRLVRRGRVLTWEAAVQKMTSIPAARIGFEESRGLLKEGYYADVVVLDPETFADTATYANPYQYSKGVDYVFINGHCAIENGVYTGALKGQILRRN